MSLAGEAGCCGPAVAAKADSCCSSRGPVATASEVDESFGRRRAKRTAAGGALTVLANALHAVVLTTDPQWLRDLS
jgi:hypothetical protein